MWHRLLFLGLMGCAPVLAVGKDYTNLASDYQVGLGVAFGTQGINTPGRYNVNTNITPVFSSDAGSYKNSLENFRASLSKTKIDRDTTKFSLFLAPLEMPEQYLQGLVPIGWVGPFGLWAPASLPADIVQGLEKTVVRMNGKSLMRFQKADLPITTGGAADMLAKAQAARSAEETAAPAPTPAPASTVGPQIKGYDPKQADRPPPGPPPLKRIDTKGPNFVKGIGTWPDSNLELERERKAREAKAAAAKKPRLTMADYAKQAEKEKADFQAKKAKAADNKQVLDWLVNDRNAFEADIRQRLQKRREYVDGQTNRRDAVMHGPNLLIEGGRLIIRLRNRTDVSLKITIDLEIYDKKGERVNMTPYLLILLPLVEEDRFLTPWDPSYAPSPKYLIRWGVEPFNYLHSY